MNNFYKCVGLAIAGLTFSVSALAGEDSLEGIYRQSIEVTQDGMMFEKGDKMMSELIIMPNQTGDLTANMNLGHSSGVVCSMENGEVQNISDNGFKVRGVDALFGDVCEMTFSKKNKSIRIKSADSNCSEFCGYGGSFEGATLDKTCDTPTQTSVDHLLDMFYMSEENLMPCE